MNTLRLLVATTLIAGTIAASHATAPSISHTLSSHLKKKVDSLFKDITNEARIKQKEALCELKAKKKAAQSRATTLAVSFERASAYLEQLRVQSEELNNKTLVATVKKEQEWLEQLKSSTIKGGINLDEELSVKKERKKSKKTTA